ncbi:MAG: cardiolipin synthase, partial [Neolewinella sp.]
YSGIATAPHVSLTRRMFLHPLSTLVLVTHWLIVSVLFARVIMKRLPVGVSLAWLAVIASAPFVGAALYLLMAERRLGRQRAACIASNTDKILQWQSALREHTDLAACQIDPLADPIRLQADHVLGFSASAGNSIELLDDSESVFDALIADIDSAQSRCHMCFYIWHEGGRATDVINALIRAAHRGVECRALADAFGSKNFLGGVLAGRLRDAGVQFAAALPTELKRAFFVRRDLRNHRKIVVIDDRIAYSGSLNLVDPQFFKQGAGVGKWVDAIMRITGPAAAALDGVFALDWAIETGGSCDLHLGDSDREPSHIGSVVQVVPSGPGLRPDAIHQLLLTAIYAARRELVLTTPYFVPDDAILTALMSAALRGVEVTLIVPARSDSLLIRYASVAHFDELMSAGVNIARFEGGLLHTKSLTIDGVMSIFGSVNLDMRSLWLNFEISLFVYDVAFTKRLKDLQNQYLSKTTLLDLEEWRRRPASRRFVENSFRLLGPLL